MYNIATAVSLYDGDVLYYTLSKFDQFSHNLKKSNTRLENVGHPSFI